MLPKQNRLTTRHQFNKVKRFGSSYSARCFHIYYLPIPDYSENKETQVGFVVSTRFSKSAVKRNRVKRVFREVVRQNFGKIKPGLWITIYPKIKSMVATYEEINTDLIKTLQNIPISR